ncbi:MAG TPA: CHAT domain-containing protein [Pyrinomonadaceae bacterium]|nr:CHAT domain-containing protein [Pyrinomonadaceae bacterium]
MTQEIEQQFLRQYLLGESLDEERRRAIEERLLTDDDYYEQLEIAEDELIQQYLGDDLNATERASFEQNFISTDERRQKFVVARSLNRYAASHPLPQEAATQTSPVDGDTSKLRERENRVIKFSRSFWSRWPAPAYVGLAATLILIVVGALLWRSYSSNSDIERGLLALNEAYRQQRPSEARITGFSYAPPPATRGAADKFDYIARDRAGRLLHHAAHAQGTPSALHALGRLYLAERQYDKAIDQFGLALRSAPDDARLHSDVGVAFMERANHSASGNSDGAKSLDFARALEHLNRALTLDASFPDALFNRALLHQSMNVPRQAADDWKNYLQLDPSSPWAEEAHRNLKLLEERQQASQAATQTLPDFLTAFRGRSDERAWQIMSETREMITGRIVPFQILRALLRADVEGRTNEADELLDALKYAGALERSRAGDSFIEELASYYSTAGKDTRVQLAAAQAELVEGYRLCQVSQYVAARAHFARARSTFTGVRNTIEARVTDYWLAYSIAQGDQLEYSVTLVHELVEFCKKRSYRWLLSQALSLLANCYDQLGDHSRSLKFNREALDIARAINDTYMQQKLLTQLALQFTQLRRAEHALDYHERTLSVAASASSSPRQNWRNYVFTAQTFYTLKRYDAAMAYEREALRISVDELSDPSLAHFSYTHLGMILAGMGRYDEAIRQARTGLDIAHSAINDSVSRKMIAYSFLQLGHLTRQAGDCGVALQHYDEALRLYEDMEIAALDGYDGHKGRLLCYLNRRNGTSTEIELSRVLTLFEQDRAEILEEQNRNSFFDAEQSVYDIAIDYFYERGDWHRAFDYSERSRGRSLLDLLTHGVKTNTATPEPEVIIENAASPLKFPAIKAQLQPGMQVVKYAVLKDKLLIFALSSKRFHVLEKSITATELNASVLQYVALLTRRDKSQVVQVRQRGERLYKLLFESLVPLLNSDEEVCIIPDKALFHLPFAALIDPLTGRYLVQDFTLLYAPSANVLVHCTRTAQQRKQVPRGETLLSVGNPAFDRVLYPDLPDLPSAEVEAKFVAQLYGGAPPLTGERAQKAAFTKLLGGAHIVHFAGHYVADERTPMRSRLLLAKNDSLTAAEVFNKRLPLARLIVLSACQTGLERYDNGEGMIGIARTFLAAGAPLVVASQWPVDSNATADLMIRFHRLRRQEGWSTTKALRQAQQEMLAGADESYRDPYYWAAFLPVGGHTDY